MSTVPVGVGTDDSLGYQKTGVDYLDSSDIVTQVSVLVKWDESIVGTRVTSTSRKEWFWLGI